MSVRVALVAKRPDLRRGLAQLLSSDSVTVVTAATTDRLMKMHGLEGIDVLVLEVDASGGSDVFLTAVSGVGPQPEIVALSRDVTAALEARLISEGAAAVLSSDTGDAELADALLTVLQRLAPSPPVPGGAGDHGSESARMGPVLELADRVAAGDSPALVVGEVGSGREWIARRIHARSRRAGRPLVVMNRAGAPETLVERDLFGGVDDGREGATRPRRGHLERARGGVLLIREIELLTPALQLRLVRALEDRSFLPPGGDRAIDVDVRVIATSRGSLEEAVEGGLFREDLYDRLAVAILEVPPLRERPEDVAPLVEQYARRFAEELGQRRPAITPEAQAAFGAYGWPGNIRELVNVVERAVLLGTRDRIDTVDLPLAVAAASMGGGAPHEVDDAPDLGAPTYEETFEAFERWYLTALLESTDGRIGQAATRAGMSRRNLYNKLRRYGLRREDFTAP